MMINTDNLVAMTEANQNFLNVTHIVGEKADIINIVRETQVGGYSWPGIFCGKEEKTQYKMRMEELIKNLLEEEE